MEYVIELILELLLEGGMEASTNKRLPKWLRYTLIAFISLFFIVIIGIVFLAAYLVLKDSIILGILIGIIGLIMLISFIFKFKKMYLEKKN